MQPIKITIAGTHSSGKNALLTVILHELHRLGCTVETDESVYDSDRAEEIISEGKLIIKIQTLIVNKGTV
jgi:Ni2+-binding GTPase involved in maturation of urease and hydrogenase